MTNSNENQIIRFDWAMKRLLRNKANFSVLEGLLTTLLGEKIIIRRLLESESNQEDEYDKYNRVDMLAENSKGELVLIEVQNNNEYAYFQRMLFGTSKLVTEYITSISIEGKAMTRSARSIALISSISLWDMEPISFIMEKRSSEVSTPMTFLNSPLSKSRHSRWMR